MKKLTNTFIDSEKLYRLCVTGESKGWEEVKSYVYKIVSWNGWSLSHQDVEDIVQEALLYFIEKIDKVKEPKAFMWLLKKKSNGLIIDYLRKKKMISVPLPEPVKGDEGNYSGSEIASPIPGPEDSYFWKQVGEVYRNVLYSLKTHCKKHLRIFFTSDSVGKELEKLAEEESKTLNAIRSEYYRCRDSFFKHPKIRRLKTLLNG